MRHAVLQVASVVWLITGCATVSSLWRSGSEDRFEAGLRALATSDYANAYNDLSWVTQHSSQQDLGRRALLVLAAIELDPRNPARRPNVGSDLAASYLNLDDRDDWVDPVAQSLYLLGLELGAAEERAERAEEKQRELPKLPGPTVSARIRNVEEERDRLAKRVESLESQLAQKERELQRIRKTIKP